MTHGSLSVRRLRVTAAAPLASRIGFAARLEDALRTSSLPAGWKGRLVLIRRLPLRAGEGLPAYLLARNIELAWRADAAQPVPAALARPDAQAVWFADEASARLALIERLARGRDVSAWFWQRWLLPGADVARQIAQLLAAPGSEMLGAEERVRYFVEACRAIGDPALIDRVTACCDQAQLRWLLPETLQRTMLMTSEGGAHHAEFNASAWSERSTDTASLGESELKKFAMRFARSALRSPPGTLSFDPTRTRPTAIDLRAGLSPAPDGEGVFTEWAGLFFALNLLGHSGQSSASVDWLRDIAAFARVAADDPLLSVLDRLELRVSGQGDESKEVCLPAPLRELRVTCLRTTRRPLRRVLRRAGLVHLNRTHLTIALRLADVSLPVRIAGLDIDPGWVALLGRVVKFEYD